MYKNGWDYDYQYDWVIKKSGGKVQGYISETHKQPDAVKKQTNE